MSLLLTDSWNQRDATYRESPLSVNSAHKKQWKYGLMGTGLVCAVPYTK